jgi:hypothetical protein
MSAKTSKGWYNIIDFGATGDGSTKITKAVQATINEASANGGGIVFFPAGTYICGTLILKSDITLFFSTGAIVLYTEEKKEFLDPEVLAYKTYADEETSYFYHSVFLGEGLQNVIVQGGGIIDNRFYKRGGPKPFAFKNCNNLTIRDLTIKNAPNYAISLLNCENITIENIKVLDAQADGIDLDNCRFGRISNCYVDSFDDAICFKTSLALGKLSCTSNISVVNCSLGSSCNCFKIGTESNGNFTNIVFSNSICFHREKTRKAISGIAIETVDGAKINNILISNVTIESANCPIFLRLGYRGRGKNPSEPGSLKNISISNISISNATFPCVIAGIPNHAICNVYLNDIIIEYNEFRESPREKIANELYPKGPKPKNRDNLFNVPEAIKNYPEADMFGILPSWGMYGRHVSNSIFRNIQFHLKKEITSINLKPSIIFENSSGLEFLALNIDYSKINLNNNEKPFNRIYYVIWLNQVSFAIINNCKIKIPFTTGLRISGNETKAVSISFPRFGKKIVLKTDPDVDINEIYQRKWE